MGMVHFVGAGPGAADLITLRGADLLKHSDVVIYAGSLVNPALLGYCAPHCRIYNSAELTLEQVIGIIEDAVQRGEQIVRLHTGDPSLYGAIREQMDMLKERGIAFDVTPGVSSFCGAAASLRAEYTLPEVSQTVIITRMAGRTPVPERENIEKLASHGSTMVIFLSAGMLPELQETLLKGAYKESTPAALVYKATWPEERIVYTPLGMLARAGEENNISRTALVLVGDFLGESFSRSRLYDPSFSTGYRVSDWKFGIKSYVKTDGQPDEAASGQPDEAASEQPRKAAIMRSGEAITGHSGEGPDESGRGKLFLVGLGPGNNCNMTAAAEAAVNAADVLCGYSTYLELISERFAGKELYSTPMRHELERCRWAVERASRGASVAMLCSGDTGVYGMAGPVLEMAADTDVDIEIIPGITAATSGAALIGAPLMNDFCVISLSDILTPWHTIERRLRCAGEGDFSVAIYNPCSKKRPHHLERACDILLEYRAPDTVCGWVRNIGREGEEAHVTALAELKKTELDMFCTVFIGSSETRNIGGKMVTPRGYKGECNS